MTTQAVSATMVPSRRLAQPALVCAAHGAVGAADLQVAGDPLQRHSDHDPPARGARRHSCVISRVSLTPMA